MTTRTDKQTATRLPGSKPVAEAFAADCGAAEPSNDPAEVCLALQHALATVGEQLDEHERATTSGFRQLQDKLAAISQQLEAAEQRMSAHVRQVEENARSATAAHGAATHGAGGKSEAALQADIEEDLADEMLPHSASGSTPRVVEPRVAQAPPPAGTPSQLATEHSAAAQRPVAGPAAGRPAVAHPSAAHPSAAQPRAAQAGAGYAPQPAPPVAARPVPQAVAATRPATGGERAAWERALLGDDLAGYTSPGDRAELIEGLLAGDETAIALVGQLMIFNAASAERMPQLLKDVGEAYYAWRPHADSDAFRDALIAYLSSRCQDIGVGNTIEIVRPGDRYDLARHNSKQRGVEIDDVHGWVVLRDNGKVYTKASVSVK